MDKPRGQKSFKTCTSSHALKSMIITWHIHAYMHTWTMHYYWSTHYRKQIASYCCAVMDEHTIKCPWILKCKRTIRGMLFRLPKESYISVPQLDLFSGTHIGNPTNPTHNPTNHIHSSPASGTVHITLCGLSLLSSSKETFQQRKRHKQV